MYQAHELLEILSPHINEPSLEATISIRMLFVLILAPQLCLSSSFEADLVFLGFGGKTEENQGKEFRVVKKKSTEVGHLQLGTAVPVSA